MVCAFAYTSSLSSDDIVAAVNALTFDTPKSTAPSQSGINTGPFTPAAAVCTCAAVSVSPASRSVTITFENNVLSSASLR